MRKYKELSNSVVLSEMASKSDGSFCAEFGKGASLVMMGTYIIDQRDTINYAKGFYFKPDPSHYYAYLQENIAEAKKSTAKVGVSALSIKIKDSIDFLKAAEQLGADYLSYCAHSVMDMFLKTNTSSALCKKENWDFLKRTIYALKSSLNRPLLLKIGAFDNPDVIASIDIMMEEKIDLLHVNVENVDHGAAGLGVLRDLKKEDLFIIAGGGIKDVKDALSVLDTGADAVSVGTAALKNKRLCEEIRAGIRSAIYR
jgi:dihydroorotate dehydrogenase